MPRKSENLIFSIDPVTSEKTNYLQARGAAVEAVNTASDPLEDDNDESPEAALQFIPEEEAPEFSDVLKGRMPYIAGGLAVATALSGWVPTACTTLHPRRLILMSLQLSQS